MVDGYSGSGVFMGCADTGIWQKVSRRKSKSSSAIMTGRGRNVEGCSIWNMNLWEGLVEGWWTQKIQTSCLHQLA